MRVMELKEECCGCTACKYICPVNAIIMSTDEEGFLYPEIDESKCIHCDACTKVCSFHEKYNISMNLEQPVTYGVKHKDAYIRSQSRSGGVFTTLSDFVLKQDGVIYGTVFDENFKVHHVGVETKKERDRMRGSKYVQSDLKEVFPQLKKDLEEGKWVLFTGTPCQVAGLKSFLKMYYAKLILCDLICHGVPSPKIWEDHLKYVKRKYKADRIEDVQFRNKGKFGWRAHIESFKINGKLKYTVAYKELFDKNYDLRPCCFNCKFTNMNRPADFTLADFWGLTKEDQFDDNKGVSLLFLNTRKAVDIFEELKEEVYLLEVKNRSFVHPNLKEPTSAPKNRAKFWEDYKTSGYEYVVTNYTNNAWGVFIKVTAKRLKMILLNNLV